MIGNDYFGYYIFKTHKFSLDLTIRIKNIESKHLNDKNKQELNNDSKEVKDA